MSSSASYAAAGVDIEAGDRAVELMKCSVARTERPEVRGGLGGFAGMFALDVAKYRRPVLAASTDGVGTKLQIARALERHDTIGIDLVAMVVDDLVVVGAEPLFLTDYIATGKVVPERIAAIVAGIAEGCVQAGCALIGGETAEHPGVMEPDDYDVSASGVGVVEAGEELGPHRVQDGDVLIAMAASGLHSNGYSLARAALLPTDDRSDASRDAIRAALAEAPDLLGGRTLGDEMLEPTRIYAKDVLALAGAGLAHAFAHITGGGLAGNLVRVIPAGAEAVVDRGTWTPAPIFQLIAARGAVPGVEMERTFNLGVGMVAVVPPAAESDALALLAERGIPAWALGVVRSGAVASAVSDATGAVRLIGEQPALHI